ncbi:MAG: DEAD/DEAH box helicase, partial [Planctomycetota bacterium]
MARKRKTNASRTRGKAAPKRAHRVLTGFLPPVARWFSRTFQAPSPAQVKSWPVIRRGDNTLLLAPTGSGKTLAAFLCAIDNLYRLGRDGQLGEGVHVLYISPLKALGNDIHKNLMQPLKGIRRGKMPPIRTAVRTGDTPPSERAMMIRKPPHILITTPESLYLLLGSTRMADNLRSIRTVIVDEVHAVCSNKRGVHLAVSLERLAERVDGPLQRIGCSATLSPLDEIAAFLVGRDEKGRRRPCTVIDAGMRENLDVQVAAPLPDFLEASNNALWASAYERLVEEISAHDTTLVFCNSRYKAERTSLRLAELAGEDVRVGVHHGSVSRQMRLEAEDDLKAGRLDALVATASLELGIDIGSVDLVYQLESAKSAATALQRIGRAGHLLDRTSKGRVLIFDRDELVEAAAINRAILEGRIDEIRVPTGCLDVLAQQIVACVAAGDRDAYELLELIRRSHPYADLSQEDYEAVLGMLSGDLTFDMAMPPRPLVLWDRSTGRLSAGRSSAHVAAMCVGTIPETSEYDVVIRKGGKRVGKVQSEFVDDSLRVGDVFVLGSTAWKLEGVERNRLLVAEAPGATPTVPWWSGPIAPRTAEVGEWVGQVRRRIAARLDRPGAAKWLAKEYHLCPNAAAALAGYVREQRTAVGVVPDHEQLLAETWRDELGRVNVIVHCPFGQRINRTWGAALAASARKRLRQRWAVTASNDLVILTLEKRSRSRVDARKLLAAVEIDSLDALITEEARRTAVFGGAFRDAAVCSLQILRAWQGRRVPAWLQTYRAGELREAAGDRQDYPVVMEVMRSYLAESLDVPGLKRLLERIESGRIQLTFEDVESPSPFAHSLLIQDQYRGGHQMGRDRRAHLLRLHRQVLQEVLSTEQMAQLLDGRAIEQLERKLLHRSEVTMARGPDELARAIRNLGDPPATMEAIGRIADGDPVKMISPLIADGRVVAIELPDCEAEPVRLVAADLWRQYHDAHARGSSARRLTVLTPRIEDREFAEFTPTPAGEVIPARWRGKTDRRQARRAVVERCLRCRGPVTMYEIANHTGWPAGIVERILNELVDDGKAARGVYTPDKPTPQWVNKANLEEIHRLTLRYLKRELAACAPYEVVDFLIRWQHLHPSTRLEGIDGLREVIGQLQGVELVTGAVEPEMIAGRVADYKPQMLEKLIAAGEVCWRRIGVDGVKRGRVTLCLRRDTPWLSGAAKPKFDTLKRADVDIPDEIRTVREYFAGNATAFFDDVVADLKMDEGAAMRAVWYLAWCGELTCDTYECLRYADFQVTMSACYDLDSTPRDILRGGTKADRPIRHMKRRRMDPRLGRWSATERLVPPAEPLDEPVILRQWARQLLRRWGIVTRDMLKAEVAAPSWGRLAREFKRLELLGEVSRGYFIEGHHGAQYGLPEAIELLRDCRARRADGKELGYLPDEPPIHITSR